MRKKVLLFSVLGMMTMVALGGCFGAKKNSKETSTESTSQSQVKENPLYNESQETKKLMKQVAEKEVQNNYSEFLVDKPFAAASIFDLEKDGDKRTAYVWLQTGEFVIFKDKAYRQSGSQGYAIIEYSKTGKDVSLEKVTWAEDGDTGKWMKEHFSDKAVKKTKNFSAYEGASESKISFMLNGKAEAELNVPVEKENLLEIDTDKKTYQLVQTKEEGSPENGDYKFDTVVLEEGKLKDIK